MQDLFLPDLRGTGLISLCIKFVLSVVCGGLIGLERGKKGQAAGFRTHILVCTGACIAMVTGQFINQYVALNADPARLGAQVISGIGFLGAGTIISTNRNKVRGLTTAAGLWADACIGLALGVGFYEAAIGGTIVVILAIVVFHRLDEIFYSHSPLLSVYMEVESIDCVRGMIQNIRSHQMKISSMEVQKPRSGLKDGVGIALTVKKVNRKDDVDMLDVLSGTEGLAFIEEVF